MPVLPRVPKYRHYRPKGLGVVRLDGRDIYLGPYGSDESVERYNRLIAEWLVGRAEAKSPSNVTGAAPATSTNGAPSATISVNELILAYWRFAETYYVKDGKPTKELACMKEALRPLRHLYGRTPAAEFGPKALKAVRQHLVQQGLCRNVVNHRISRIKRVFKWAVAEELVPASVHHGLQAVAGLRYGRTEARETEPVRPVDDMSVEALLPFLPPTLATMVQVQRLTGMRPCEVVLMRPCDIDRTDETWIYEPHDHKMRWRGHHRLVPIGPKAQRLLRPLLDRSPEAYLFSPRESEAWRQEQRAKQRNTERKTPVYPCELRARERAKAVRRQRWRKRPPRDRFDTGSYRRAIGYAIKKAQRAGVAVEHWHPNQLRHNRGTEVRRTHGIEAAQLVLGHARADVTQVYAEKNLELAKRIAQQTG